MAHSDTLIFLTNITWIFFLFLFTYFFFVLFVLPTFYKKFRTRVLIKNINFLGGVLATRNVLVSLIFCVDTFRGLNSLVIFAVNSTLFFFKSTLSFSEKYILAFLPSSFQVALSSSEVVQQYYLNLLFVDSQIDCDIVFTRYLKT